MRTFAATDTDAFKSLGRSWAATVTVVTARHLEPDPNGEPKFDGFTCTAFLMVSMTPPIILVSVTTSSQAHATMRSASSIAVNFLGPEQSDVGGAFARPSAERQSLWKELRWAADPSGAPLLEGAVGAFSAKPTQFIDAGDHTLVLADVTALHRREEFESLLYHNRGYGRVSRLG